ncbi:MAG TPA: AGE family epimerase/isomerase [Flavisolibacter sp.]|nr:AGE family epimerase/isomerase [Flavisolibacter sp.]
MKEVLKQYREEMQQELEHILAYWMKFAIDEDHGGFVGKIDHDNKIYPDAPKGSVLNSRILWTFSAAYNLTKKPEYLAVAERAFQYLAEHFIDKEFGGVYWTVDYKGSPLDTKKQIYALSFAVYGLAEYYQASKNERALQSALSIYHDIVRHSYDEKNGGYIEALTRDWKELGDLRLSAKDANEKKSMNTHLHILEGFVNLHRVSPTELLEVQLHELIRLFTERIISKKTDHLVLFFDDEWNERSQVISYGHDIEAAWLVQEAAEIIKDEPLLFKVKERALALTKAAAEGLDEDGGLWYESDPEQHHLTKQKHSWPQAEAMIGFFNAWQNTGNETFLKQSLKSWEFVKKYMHDKTGGEWYWGVYDDHSPMNKEDKAGIWKCPYHNSRACIEIIKRTTSIIN